MSRTPNRTAQQAAAERPARPGRRFSRPVGRRFSLRRRRGAFSLFLILVTTSLTLVLGVLLQATRIRADELELARAMNAQLQVSLAGFDARLRQDYGLFGFPQAGLQTDTLTRMLADPALVQSVQIKAEGNFWQVSQLRSQILRQMRLRLPLTALRFLTDQAPAWQALAGQAKSSTRTVNELLTAGGQDSAAVTTVLRELADLLGQALQPLLEPLLQKALARLDIGLGQLMGTVIPEWNPDSAGSGGSVANLLEPQTLTNLSSVLDQMADASTNGVYDHFCISEYCLSYFTTHVAVSQADGRQTNLKTIGGQSLASLSKQRPDEVEQLVTGLDRPSQAVALVHGILVGLRSLVQFAAILADSAKMSALQTEAASVSAAVALASGGLLVIDPTAMTAILAAIEAVSAGLADVQKLKAGQLVNLWPGHTSVNLAMHYRDYLRLLLLIQPANRIVERVGQLIKDRLDGEVAAEVSVSAVLRGAAYQMQSGYVVD